MCSIGKRRRFDDKKFIESQQKGVIILEEGSMFSLRFL